MQLTLLNLILIAISISSILLAVFIVQWNKTNRRERHAHKFADWLKENCTHRTTLMGEVYWMYNSQKYTSGQIYSVWREKLIITKSK